MAKTVARVSYGLTVNLGDMQFARVDAALEREVPDGQDLDSVYQESWERVIAETLRISRWAKRRARKNREE